MSKKHRHVLFLPFSYNPETHFGIAKYANGHGWHLNADMAWTGHVPPGWDGDGIITVLMDDLEAERCLRRYKKPVVDLGLMRPGYKVPRVIKDNPLIGRLGARHFLEMGWRHFAYVSRTSGMVCQLRLAGFRSELQRQGLDCRELILPHPHPGGGHPHHDPQRRLLIELRRLPKPLAVMAFNDYDAAMVLDLCLAGGLKVPGEVGVLGVDNNLVVCNSQAVTLSSVDPQTVLNAYQGAALLDQLMAGAPASLEPVLIPPKEAVMRQSTHRFVCGDARLERAVEWIVQHLGDPFSLEQVAEQVGVSRKTLYDLFMRELRQYPAQLIRRRRLQRAQALLLHTEDNLAEIARQCGIALPTFTRQFHREFGLSPQVWRQEQRKNLSILEGLV